MKEITISTEKIDSYNELVAKLEKQKSFTIGKESEQKKEFFLISVLKRNEEMLRIGIISEGHGLKPQCAISKECCIIGFNREICMIYLETFELKQRWCQAFCVNSERIFSKQGLRV